jgi:hypothetical protein
MNSSVFKVEALSQNQEFMEFLAQRARGAAAFALGVAEG